MALYGPSESKVFSRFFNFFFKNKLKRMNKWGEPGHLGIFLRGGLTYKNLPIIIMSERRIGVEFFLSTWNISDGIWMSTLSVSFFLSSFFLSISLWRHFHFHLPFRKTKPGSLIMNFLLTSVVSSTNECSFNSIREPNSPLYRI